VSEATIILGELREELADRLVAGLAGLGSRAMGSVATRLRDLELPQLAAIGEMCAARTDSSERLSDFIKLYRGISHALVRLAGATHVDRETLERVPTYESVFVRRPADRLTPADVKRLCAEGSLNRYEAAVHFAHYYEALPPEELSTHIYTAWADGSTGPYVARAFAAHGPLATDAAERVLLSPNGRVAKMTAVRVLQAAGGTRAEEVLQRVVEGMEDVALRALAEDALDALDLRGGDKDAVKKRRATRDKRLTDLVKQLLTAPQKEARCKAIKELVELGHRGALPALRRAYSGDATFDVREDAAYAIARLGDTEMVDAFLSLVKAREELEIREEVEVAIRALGKLGDVRGLPELLAAYTEERYVALVADAIRELGAAALDPLLDKIEAHPKLGPRQGVRNILQNIPAEELGGELVRRFMERASGVGIGPEADALAERATLLLKLADAQEKSRRLVAKAICDRLSASDKPSEKMLVKQAERALGLR
jgi:HEAT repeat protein